MEKFDVNYLGPGARRRTALQHAVENGNMELVNLLISEHGARIDSPPATDGGATALQIASLKGYIGIARRLLDLGADVNEDPAEYNERTALQGAAEHGRIDML
jgi:ankyrin repeat protein